LTKIFNEQKPKCKITDLEGDAVGESTAAGGEGRRSGKRESIFRQKVQKMKNLPNKKKEKR